METEKKKTKKIPDIELPEAPDKEILTRQSALWMRSNGILGDHDINHIILEAYMISKAIKHVDMLVNKEESIVCLVITLGRFSYLFKNRKKLIYLLEDAISPILQDKWALQIKIELNKGK